jgi:hypothetical protein
MRGLLNAIQENTMSEQVIGHLITLKATADQAQFEQFLIRQSQEEHLVAQGSEIQFLFYRQLGEERKYVWLIRFPRSEFERVSRSGHPFILRALQKILAELQDQQAEVERAFFTETPFRPVCRRYGTRSSGSSDRFFPEVVELPGLAPIAR